MDSRSRLETACAFREPDRVPIELLIDPRAHALPEAQRLVNFIENEVDNFRACDAITWGHQGVQGTYSEAILEDRPGEFRRIQRTWDTAAGPFVAVTRHNYPHLDSPDFHWERRFVHTLEDMVRLSEAPRAALPFDPKIWRAHEAIVGRRGIPLIYLMHPLGMLVRRATMEEVYGWLVTEKETMHRFLEAANAQLVGVVEEIGRQGIAPWFVIVAHEMLIPPWMGMRQFEEWVYPYDKLVNDAIHRIGGKLRSHCHGNCMAYLERMSAMGIDAIEPLEPPPFGDVDLAEAKRRVGDRMALSGNIPSQDFVRLKPEDVRRMVRQAIADAGHGGGFTLRTTGGHAAVDADLEPAMLRKIIANVEAYIEAGLEFGQYPLRG